MAADKGKKQKTAEVEELNNGAEQIDGELVVSIEKLQEVQEELEKINEEASEKVLEVEQKYNVICKPVYDKRNEVIKSIPDFWLTAFMSHPAVSELLTEEDQKIFKYLSNLEVEDFKDVKAGYSITFEFNSNPYFEDTKLTKTFAFLEEGITKVTATPIKWKEGMGIPNGVVEDKKGNKRPITEESFFSWFSDAEYKGDIFGIQDEVADIIKDDLWPNPLTYFNNDGDEEDPEMDDGEDDERGDGSEGSEGDGSEGSEGSEGSDEGDESEGEAAGETEGETEGDRGGMSPPKKETVKRDHREQRSKGQEDRPDAPSSIARTVRVRERTAIMSTYQLHALIPYLYERVTQLERTVKEQKEEEERVRKELANERVDLATKEGEMEERVQAALMQELKAIEERQARELRAIEERLLQRDQGRRTQLESEVERLREENQELKERLDGLQRGLWNLGKPTGPSEASG